LWKHKIVHYTLLNYALLGGLVAICITKELEQEIQKDMGYTEKGYPNQVIST
jgi:hypothetical protein